MQEQKAEKTKAAEALALLEQAWAYYTPEPALETQEQHEPELFEYANAA
jgi:hypothetical protein